LAIFEGVTIGALMIVFALGPEKKGKSFLKDAAELRNITDSG
jgi:hypothetical protein